MVIIMNIDLTGTIEEIKKKLDESWKDCRCPEDVDLLKTMISFANYIEMYGYESFCDKIKDFQGVTITEGDNK